MTENILKHIPKIDYDEIAPNIDVNEFLKVIDSRRSVRVFSQERIPEAVMRSCLSVALKAPNSSNLQPWEFVWVRSEPMRGQLVKLCLSQPAAATAGELVVCIAHTNTWQRHRRQMIEVLQARSQVPRSAKIYYEKLVPLAYGFTWPVIGWCKWLAVWMAGLFRVTPRIPCSRSGMRLWATKTVALACENIMLALRAYGYDTCPMEGMDEVRIAKMLKLPRSANVVMVIGAGRRAKGGIYGPRIRFDDSQFVREV